MIFLLFFFCAAAASRDEASGLLKRSERKHLRAEFGRGCVSPGATAPAVTHPRPSPPEVLPH